MNKLKETFNDIMKGRYGSDHLNVVLVGVGFIFWIINLFLKNSALVLLTNIMVIYALYRSLSKNIWIRQKENLRFLDLTKNFRNKLKIFKLNLTDKNFKYFICPNCKQMVKVPKGKGKIEISCPRCNTKFDRRS
ncbi:MAG: hypothetical protein GX675_03255 [Erysipelotrichaceae bacterium]|nr:hypothetical protein [Erysipelotrichaceae bacterium]